MTDTLRALCAELATTLAERIDDKGDAGPYYTHAARLLDRARAALAKPADAPAAVAERPSDEELRDLWSWAAGQDQGPWPTQYHCFARAVLARWGRPAAAPVPASERLPGPEDCDEQGRYWGLVMGCEAWVLAKGDPRLVCITHWLPANALPLPAPEGGEAQP